MAEKRYTGAGEFGQGVRSALSSAYDYVSGNIKDAPRKTKLLFDEYLSNPLYNKYPQLLLNPTNIPLAAAKAGVEALGGVANVPINLSDNALTQEEPEPPEPTPTLKNRDLLSEYYGGFDNVPVRRAEAVNKKQESKKLNYVVKTYGENPTSEIFTDKEKAKAALKNLYAKNQKATMSNVPEDQAEQFAVGSMEKVAKNKEAIRKLRSPQTEEEVLQVAENKGRMEEAWAEANKAKRAKDKERGAEFASWVSGVKARRESEGMLNDYNKQLGLLNRAYSQAKQADDPLAAYQIQEYIQEYKSGVPKEMGARKKFAESGALQERNEMLRRKMEEAKKQAEKERQLAMVNPDYNR